MVDKVQERVQKKIDAIQPGSDNTQVDEEMNN